MKKAEERETVTIVNQHQKMFGIIHRPLVKEKVPAIIICPGFAGSKSGKFRLFVTLGEELAKLGFAVLRFDYRGAGDSEGDFSELTIEGKISDTLQCLTFLSEDPTIDSSRIGLLGRSLGGFISILAAQRHKRIKSLALWAPVFHSDPWKELWEAFKANQLEESLNKKKLQLPPHIPNIKFIEEFFKINFENELKSLAQVPLLHIHGKLDRVVTTDHAEAYRKNRLDDELTRFVELSKSDHDFSDFSEQKIAIMETCKWFQQTL